MPPTTHAATTSTTTMAFQCDDDPTWELSWSLLKKTFCCQTAGKGCASQVVTTTTTVTEAFDCDSDLSCGKWKIAWSAEKKRVCCAREAKGCEDPGGHGPSVTLPQKPALSQSET